MRFVGQLAASFLAAVLWQPALAQNVVARNLEPDIQQDGSLGKPAQFGLDALANELATRSFALTGKVLVGTLANSQRVEALRSSGQLPLSSAKESLCVKRLAADGKPLLVIAGADDRGLMYALLEVTQQLRSMEAGADWPLAVRETSEAPTVPVRSMSILLHSEDCEADWYYSKAFWRDYFAMLAASRWNAFNLVFSHQTPYLSPLYAFHVKVDEYPEVKAKNLTEAQRERNLAMLRFITTLAKDRGIDFKIGIWQQIAWEGKHQGEKQQSMVQGLTRDNMHSYTYKALRKLLEECPGIQAVQLRINHESGIDYDEQTDFYRDSVFRAIKDCGRPIQLEMRNVGLLRETLDAALDMGIPSRVSHKYWAEHMVSPYHPTRIMWTYSYGDWLKHPQRYQNLYHVWSLGSHRLLLWGNPNYVRRFAPTTLFQNADGFEICAPLSQKGYGNAPGAWRIFKDPRREHYRWEFERYWSFYTLFGRLTYNPNETDEIWLREMRRRFGDAAKPVAEAYRAASTVVESILSTATADYNMYVWPEIDCGALINFYLHCPTFNEPRISNFQEYIKHRVSGGSTGKRSPEDMATRLSATAARINAHLAAADAVVEHGNKEYWATKQDFRILSGMADYFANKIRATYQLGLFYETGDYTALQEAAERAEHALTAWQELAAAADEIYHRNLIMGPASRGHWKDKLVFVEDDLKQIRYQMELFALVGDFDYGFDFGPPAYTDVTEIYTPWYTNNYHVEHRFKEVSPQCRFNPQQGFGWNSDVRVTAERPKKVPRSVWRASNTDDLRLPSHVLTSDFIQGTEPAVFRLDLPEGHYQATLIFTDRNPDPRDHGPMNVAVVERFGKRPILTDVVVKKGEQIVKRFDFNMVGSRYSNFRIEMSAAPGHDYILNALTFTRIEPHIAHVPVRRATPGEDLTLRATVSLPPQVLHPHKDSLSIARGTTSTIEPPARIATAHLVYSRDGQLRRIAMNPVGDYVYAATIPAADVHEGILEYYFDVSDSIGQTISLPSDSGAVFACQVTRDAAAPLVTHTPTREWEIGKPLDIRAKVTDPAGVARVVLHYRPTRQAMEYSQVAMLPTAGGDFVARIPGAAFTAEYDLIYFFEAIDNYGNGTFYPDPDREDPHLVVKVKR